MDPKGRSAGRSLTTHVASPAPTALMWVQALNLLALSTPGSPIRPWTEPCVPPEEVARLNIRPCRRFSTAALIHVGRGSGRTDKLEERFGTSVYIHAAVRSTTWSPGAPCRASSPRSMQPACPAWRSWQKRSAGRSETVGIENLISVPRARPESRGATCGRHMEAYGIDICDKPPHRTFRHGRRHPGAACQRREFSAPWHWSSPRELRGAGSGAGRSGYIGRGAFCPLPPRRAVLRREAYRCDRRGTARRRNRPGGAPALRDGSRIWRLRADQVLQRKLRTPPQCKRGIRRSRSKATAAE